MKCPNCHHVSDTQLLKCSACNKTYDRNTLETFQHLEYLLDWVHQQADTLGPTTHARLRDDVLRQLGDLRSALHLAPLPAPEKIASKLALVETALGQLQGWVKAAEISPASATGLREHLSSQADDLKKQLVGQTVQVESPSHLEVLDFAIESLPLWTKSLSLPYADASSLHQYLGQQRAALLQRVARQVALAEATRRHLWDWVKINRTGLNTANALHKYLAGQANGWRKELADTSVETEPLSDLQVLDFALESLPQWAARFRLPRADVASLRHYLEGKRAALLQPAPPAPAPKPAAPPAPRPKPVPKAPPKPKQPPINWSKVWEKAVEAAVSGALLRGLLYLGAFMIVVASAILVILFWDIFPEMLQLAFIAAVPTAFYLAGWGARAKLELPEVGSVLTGIGALLVAVAFAGVYQFGELYARVDGNGYWLGASIFCTLVYAATAWRLPGEFFNYISLIGGTSTLLAFTRLLHLPIEWSVASVIASSVLMIGAAAVLKQATARRSDLVRACRYLPQILIPASLAVVLFVPGDATFGQMGSFALATLGYGLLAWRFPAVIFAHATVWSSIGTVGLAIWAVDLPVEWYASTAAVIGFLYILTGWEMGERLSEDLKPRRGYLVAAYLAGFGLVAVAVLAGFATLPFDLWAGIVALTLSALVLAGCAYLFRRPVLVLLASGLFIVPFSLAVGRWLLDAQVVYWEAWLMTAWAGLALAYLGIAVLLRTADKYGRWLNLWAHVLAPVVLCGLCVLIASYGLTPLSTPTMIALGGVILVYLVSAMLHDSGQHPALSNWVKWLPAQVERAIFLWPIGLLLPVWLTVFWSITVIGWPWLGVALVGLALAYVGLGQLLAQRKAAYRLPPHTYAYALSVVAILVAWGDRWALLATLYLVVGVLTALAFVYRRTLETSLAALLFIWPFQLSLELSPLTPHAHSFAYALLVCLGYTPLGLALNKAGDKYVLPTNCIAGALSVYAMIASLLGRFGGYPLDVPWVGVAVPLMIAGLQVFYARRSAAQDRFEQAISAWAGALIFPIAFGQALTLLHVPFEYDAAAWVGLAFAYLLVEAVLVRSKEEAWFQVFRWPLRVGTSTLCTLGLLLTAGGTVMAFGGRQIENIFPLILAQAMAVGLATLMARLYRSRWPLYLEPWLAFFPVTLFFIGYGEAIFGQPLTTPQYGIVWSVLGLVHLLTGALLDHAKVRYAHGLYLGAYALGLFAILWTLPDRATLLWTLGLGIVAAVWSALLVHFDRHRTWDDLMTAFFGQKQRTARSTVRGAFLWLAAWPFPAWCVLLLRQLNAVEAIAIADEFIWLSFGVSALLFLGLAVWLRRVERTYAWPFHTAAQFYTVAGLVVSAPLTVDFFNGRYHLPQQAPSGLAFILLQALAVTFYAASAWALRRRFFAHVASWLSVFPYTLAWIVYDPAFAQVVQARFAWIWTGWAAVLLAVGFALDRERKVRYAHGPYLAGYALMGLALAWSAQDRLVNVYTLAADIGLALVSHVLVHYGQHRSFDDLVGLFWRKPGTVARRAARTVFLFFAAYAFPVWLVQLLTHHNVPLAWRGLALALSAPIYIAFGLAARRVKSEYTWPLYSAGYALTALGAMVTYDDLALAIYVLALDAVVYAVSATIFRQPFWLYLSNVLVPVIALLTLRHNESLTAPWVSGTLMGLAFLYFGVGRLFDSRKETRFFYKRSGKNLVSRWSLPFYAPGYVMSAIALAAASGERSLAINVYSTGVVLYALSAWAFRESVFLYPATWLVTVPYYLGMTLTPLEPCWYGLGWLPLIVAYIGLGRLVFQQKPLGITNLRTFLVALAHPTMPFYLLAYGLSVSMIVLSQGDMLPFTVALAVGAAVYTVSAVLFRHPAWLYPGLLTAHLAVAAYFAINPSGNPKHYITLPFLGMTWITALMGYGLSRLFPVARRSHTGKWVFTLERWKLDFGNLPFLGYLVTPSWAQPLFIFAALDLVVWQTLALASFETGIILAAGNALLLGLFAMLWLDTTLVYGALGLFLLGVGYRLGWAELPFADAFAWMGGIGFGLYFVARIAEHTQKTVFTIWSKPLTNVAAFLTAVAVVVTLPMVGTHTTAFAAALAFAGALYLAIAYRGRHYGLGYLGMAMLQLAWALVLIIHDVSQPQWYAVPAGLYFTGVGYLERRRGRGPFATIVESFGLAVLLVTTFIQSLDGAQGFPYFVLLLGEGLLVVGWGATRQLKMPFFIGLAASTLNVVAQLVVLIRVYEVNRWFIILGVGLLLVTTAAFVERKRGSIVVRTHEWRDALETWG